jgi:phosphopantothenoylcysteine decarboxylase/phosphopantothenate--cysteine ligase
MVHPSKRIIGEISKELSNRKILLGVTGSIAIYKSIDLARDLMRRGAEIYVLMTKGALKLVSSDVFEWATGNPVITKLSGKLEHVELSEELDSMLIAPATANTVVKIAEGISDTTLTTTALNFIGKNKPVFIVPSMHLPMYQSPQVKRSLEYLKSINVKIIEPIIIKDIAHYPELELISSQISAILNRGEDLKGLKLIVTAGPTREHLDPVRFISNPSSGTMGIAIANEAYFRGADVVLIHGPLCSKIKPYVKTEVEILTTENMADEVRKYVEKGYDIVILAGAPADFKFKMSYNTKIDTHNKDLPRIEIERTPKISEYIRGKAFIVGFSAETVENDNELLNKAKMKKNLHGFDIIVTNNVKRKDIGFSSEYDEVYIIGNSFTKKIDKTSKQEIARELLDIVKKEFKSNISNHI